MPDTSVPPTPRPSFVEALRFWAKLGLISFGGPAGQIAIMQTELVDRRRWIDQGAFLRGLGFCTLLPGPEAQQLATYVGWRLHGARGGLAAGLLFILPGAALMLMLSWIAATHADVGPVAAILDGLKPMVVAIVAHAVLRIGKRTLTTPQAAAVAIAAFLAIQVLHIDFPWIVLVAGATGWFMATRFPFSGDHANAPADDEGISPRGDRRRLAALIGLFLLLWVLPVGAILVAFGRDPFLHVAALFTKAAFVTFGGAYAVLPYVADAAVNDYAWLSPEQMINGLALAETTPGPLILVLQYVGFFAGWSHAVGIDRTLAAVLAALLTTYVTFLPSFLFIFAGAPYVDRLHARAQIASALGAITAAVVGVVLNLAVFVGREVLFAQGGVDAIAAIAAIAAFAVLARFNLGVPWLVGAGIVLGLARWAVAL